MTLRLRLIRLLGCFFVVATMNFALPRLMPGDPTLLLLGPEWVALSRQDHEALKKECGLDKPLWVQYTRYWMDLAQGRLGYSYHYRRPVAELIQEHLSRTLWLVLPAVLLSIGASAFLGTLAGWKPGSLFDVFVTTLGLLAYALPSFLTAMVLLDLFSLRLHCLPTGGLVPSLQDNTYSFHKIMVMAKHLLLPVTVLTLTSFAAKFFVMRNAVVDMLQEPFVVYARARGLSTQRVLLAYVFLNACLPLVHLSALHLGFVISGSVLVEIVFSINGMGSLIYQAATHRDYPLLQGCFLVLAVVVMSLNVFIDWFSKVLDPRIKN